jgi:hypothetical protein
MHGSEHQKFREGTSHDDPEVTERGHRTLRRLHTIQHP